MIDALVIGLARLQQWVLDISGLNFCLFEMDVSWFWCLDFVCLKWMSWFCLKLMSWFWNGCLDFVCLKWMSWFWFVWNWCLDFVCLILFVYFNNWCHWCWICKLLFVCLKLMFCCLKLMFCCLKLIVWLMFCNWKYTYCLNAIFSRRPIGGWCGQVVSRGLGVCVHREWWG